MIQKIGIKNYKSIVEDEIELGRINVFIGENGAGKSNILEAIAMLSAYLNFDLSVEGLYNRGIRVTLPKLMLNSFKKLKTEVGISICSCKNKTQGSFDVLLSPLNPNDIFSKWVNKNKNKTIPKNINSIFNQINNTDLIVQAKSIMPLIKDLNINPDVSNQMKELFSTIMEKTDSILEMNYQIYSLSTLALRGVNQNSKRQPLGINGEGLDILISTFNKEEMKLLKEYSYFISWLKEVMVDEQDILKFKGHKLNRSISRLYFKDQYMKRTNNIFAAENANEGALYVLFYLALFISKKTPSFFAIDNIETALNPKLCRELMKSIAALSKKTDKQALITTHNPAILDGINLHDDEQRLFVVSRTDEGHTKTRRIKLKPKTGKMKYKLSELWMNGDLGGIPNNFL